MAGMRGLSGLFLIAVLLFVVGCGPSRPVLYPNSHYDSVGQAQAQADIDECIRFAKDAGADKGKGKKIAKNTAKGAAIGAITGAAIGSVSGDFGKGAAYGAAGGGAGGFAREAVNAGEPDAVFKSFVDRCLREKGYEPMGWK